MSQPVVAVESSSLSNFGFTCVFYVIRANSLMCKRWKENPQKLTQLSSRSHPRYLVGKRTAQKDITIDTTSDSQVNSNFPNRWSPASLTFNTFTGTEQINVSNHSESEDETVPSCCFDCGFFLFNIYFVHGSCSFAHYVCFFFNCVWIPDPLLGKGLLTRFIICLTSLLASHSC